MKKVTMIKKMVLIVSCILFLVSQVYGKTFKVALFSPKGDSPFWSLVTNFAQEAANDLGIELIVYDAKLNQFTMVQQLKEAVTGPDKVDAVLFSNFKQFGTRCLDVAEEAQVPAFMFNSGLTAKQRALAKKPREKYKFWVGVMTPDDEGAAEQIANVLINDALNVQKLGADKKIHVVGIAGINSDASSIVRVNGLKRAIAGRQNVVLEQVVDTDWGAEMGKEKFLRLYKRYPQTSVVWSASYRITDGIIEGMQQENLNPGEDLFTNSVVLNEQALKDVSNGKLSATVGGHYIEGAWGIVMLHDYLNNIDFASESIELKTPMGIVTKDNVELYLKNITAEKLSPENLRKIDFTRYSKKLNPELNRYNFDLDSVLKQL